MAERQDHENNLLDPRLTPARADLAAKYLSGKVAADRFVEGRELETIDPVAPLRRHPSSDAPLDTEVLKGERVTVYEVEEGWAWVQLASDGYVGFMPANALGPPGAAATHKVSALRTLVFPGPSIKLPPVEALPFGARVSIVRAAPPFAVTAAGGYIAARHLAPLATTESDIVGIAERFLGTPYLWGGRTSLGLDCSGLVQVAANACGIPCPRDSDMQERALGSEIPCAELASFRRGDFLFWPGHVAIVRNSSRLIHANAFHMQVASEPLLEAVERIRATGSELRSARRIVDRV
ncbi:MAG: NlpC/P60 family protein [Xanthobacteraceae bacterium]